VTAVEGVVASWSRAAAILGMTRWPQGAQVLLGVLGEFEGGAVGLALIGGGGHQLVSDGEMTAPLAPMRW
jgi:hypothetical protein